MEYSTETQSTDDEITPYREGFMDYLFGKYLWQNPYKAFGDVEIDDPAYYQWYDGWNKALEIYPEIEPQEE